MNREQAKKAREKDHLERFLALQGITPAEKKPSESPDFILDLGDGRRVGVELVGVDDQAQIATNARADREIAQKVESALREKGYRVQVQLHWTFGLTRFSEEPKRIGMFLQKLMAVIDREAPSLGDADFVLTNINDEGEEDQRLHELDLDELAMLVIQKLAPPTEPHVEPFSYAWPQGDHPVVEVLRDKKERNVPEYRRNLGPGELWLLIVTGERFEQNVSADLVQERNMQSQFDRIFLLDLQAEKVVTLK